MASNSEVSPETLQSVSLPRLIMNVTEAYDCMLNRLYVNVILCGSLCLFGVVGNIVSFFVLGRDKCSPVASLLLQSLAVVDAVFLLLAVIHYSIRDVLYVMYRDADVQQKNLAWSIIRVYTYPVLFICQMAAMYIIVLVAVSRYMAVCLPYKANIWCSLTRMRAATFAVLICSVLYNVPRFFEHKVYTNATVEYTLTRNKWYTLLYQNIFYNLFAFGLPLLILMFLNTKLTIVYRKVVLRKRASLQNRNSPAASEDNITKIMIIVVLVFILCNLPSRLILILTDYDVGHPCSTSWWLAEFATVLEIFNASVNFIIYCVFRSRFRAILGECLGCRARSMSPSRNSMALTDLKRGPNHLDTCETQLLRS